MQRIKRFIKNKSIFQNPEWLKLNNICLKNYIWNKCILRKRWWKLVFKGKCLKNLWGIRNTLKFKITNAPNEIALNAILNGVGLEIFDEKLLPADTIYFIRERHNAN